MKIINNETKEIVCYDIDYENGLICKVRTSDEYTEYRYEYLGYRVYYFDDDYLNKIISREITNIPSSEFHKVFHSPNLTSSFLQRSLFEFNEFSKLYKVSTGLEYSIVDITEAITEDRVPLIEELNLVELYNNVPYPIKDIELINFLDLCMRRDWILTKVDRRSMSSDKLYEKFMSTFKVKLIYPDSLYNELNNIPMKVLAGKQAICNTIYNYIRLGKC